MAHHRFAVAGTNSVSGMHELSGTLRQAADGWI